MVVSVRPKRDIFAAVLAISWFYFVGGAFLAQFPTYAKATIGADEQVATLFLSVFSVGIGAGSMACNALLKGEVSGRYVPAAAVGMSAMSVLLYLMSGRSPLAEGGALIGIWTFLASPQNLGVLLCLLGISFCGGLYIVPLYAIIQSRSGESELAQVTACTNVMDSLFMVLASAATAAMLAVGMEIPQIFLALALMTLAAAWIIRRSRLFD